MPPPTLIELPDKPDPALVLQSSTEGAMLFDGWSDAGAWRILLPWPEEIRQLEWREAASWNRVIEELDATVAEDDSAGELPFSGGWAGFVTYEALATGEGAEPWSAPPPEPPLFFARHRAGIASTPDGRALLFAPPGTEREYASRLIARSCAVSSPARRSVVDSLGDGRYRGAVLRIRDAIRDGDVYQVNLTRALRSPGEADAATLYHALVGRHPPCRSAFIRGRGWTIASASPELFVEFDRERGIAESQPIKGTVRRSGDDAVEVASLLGSAKDAAEHLMIVDVVRNDFGKIAPAGRVDVAAFREVRSLAAVHHLESTVTASGLHGTSLADLMAALSPAASITGAPKRAAVRLIRETEPVPRGVYCGAIGMISGRGAAFSVAIRTAVIERDGVRYHAGGGIVWDSDAAAEDDECRAKAAAFLRWAGGET